MSETKTTQQMLELAQEQLLVTRSALQFYVTICGNTCNHVDRQTAMEMYQKAQEALHLTPETLLTSRAEYEQKLVSERDTALERVRVLEEVIRDAQVFLEGQAQKTALRALQRVLPPTPPRGEEENED